MSANCPICDQAIFTCVRTTMAQGYRVIAASGGLAHGESSEIARLAPSGNGLCGDSTDATGISFHTLSTGRYAILHTAYAGKEPTGRGGLRTYTRAFVLDADGFRPYRNNPFAVLRVLASNGGLAVDLDPPRLMPMVELSTPSTESVDALATACEQIGDAWFALLVERLLAGRPIIVAARGDRAALAEAVILAMPSPLRPSLSLSVNLRFSVGRMSRFNLIGGEGPRVQQLVRGREAELLDLESHVKTGNPASGSCDAMPLNTGEPPPAPAIPGCPRRVFARPPARRPAVQTAAEPVPPVMPVATHGWALAVKRYLSTNRGQELVSLTSNQFAEADLDSLERLGIMCMDLDNVASATVSELIDTAAIYLDAAPAGPLSEKLSHRIVAGAKDRLVQRILRADRADLNALWWELRSSVSSLPNAGGAGRKRLARFVDDIMRRAIDRMSMLDVPDAAGMVLDAAGTGRFAGSADVFERTRNGILSAMASWAAHAAPNDLERACDVLRGWRHRFRGDLAAGPLIELIEKKLIADSVMAETGPA